MKVLILDIETRPNLAYVWALWDQNIGLNQIVEVGQIISFAAKWHGEKQIEFRSDFHDGHEEMIKKAYELVDEADVIVHYNGRNFDMKHLNTEFLLAGMTPPSPHKDVDLLAVVRSRFRFVSNKLQHVCQQLGIGSKQETGGFDLWVKCMAGDAKAWKNMRKYNIGDILITEKLYDRTIGWIKTHPNPALYNGTTDMISCPNCGSKHVQKRGFGFTQVSEFQQYQCQNDACGKYFRETKRTEHVAVQPVS